MLSKSLLVMVIALSTVACSDQVPSKQAFDNMSPAAWTIEQQSADARVVFQDGVIDVDTPEGITLWYNKPLEAPVQIEFEVLAVADGGPNDHVSDINAFWMATNSDGSAVLSQPRTGTFADYDSMRAYYVGIGGNRNTTTRMRRYVGRTGDRPILPEHDLSGSEYMITPGAWNRICLIAEEGVFGVERNGRRLFTYAVEEPYNRGHFGLRTTKSHLLYRNIRVGECHDD